MEKCIALLEMERAEIANAALLRPTDRSSFEYGNVSGKFQALTRAIEVMREFMAGKEEEEDT